MTLAMNGCTLETIKSTLEPKKAEIKNVYLTSGFEGQRFCAHGQDDIFAYRIWFNPDTFGFYYSADKEQRLLYRKKLNEFPKKSYHALGIFIPKNAAIIVAMFDIIEKENLVARLKRQVLDDTDKTAARLRQEHALWLMQQAGPDLYYELRSLRNKLHDVIGSEDAARIDAVLQLAEKGKPDVEGSNNGEAIQSGQ